MERFHNNNATTVDRCIGSNNSSIVTLTEVSTVTIKGSLSSNARTYEKGHIRKVSLTLTVEERSLTLAAEERSLALTSEERSLALTVIEERSLALTSEGRSLEIAAEL
jgi:hypothetical protein